MRGFAIAFDIDGVLTRGGTNGGHKPLKGAREALAKLRNWSIPGHSKKHVIPIVFVTNGGGCTEAEKAKRLCRLLEVDDITADQIVMCHTPLKALVPRLGNEHVVFVGPNVYSVASSYGFKHAQSLEDYTVAHPDLFGHRRYPHPELALSESEIFTPEHDPPVKAVMILADGLDWSQELQIMMDLLSSNGTPGQAAPPGEQIVELFHCNPDFEYSGAFSWPRFTAGALLECLKALYRRSVGRELQVREYGKPCPTTYEYAEELINAQLNKRQSAESESSGLFTSIDTIYMVGDNPKSDIRGANNKGGPWKSVLVRSGMFKGENDAEDPAYLVCDTVLDAIETITRAFES